MYCEGGTASGREGPQRGRKESEGSAVLALVRTLFPGVGEDDPPDCSALWVPVSLARERDSQSGSGGGVILEFGRGGGVN